MISIITQRFGNSLVSLNTNQLKLLTNRTTSIIYRDFHNILLGVQDPEATDIVNSMNETHNNRIKALKNEHQEEIDKLINKSIDEVHNFSIKIEKIKEELRFESDIKMENVKNLHNDILLLKDERIEFLNLEKKTIKNEFEQQKNNELLIYINQIKDLNKRLDGERLDYENRTKEQISLITTEKDTQIKDLNKRLDEERLDYENRTKEQISLITTDKETQINYLKHQLEINQNNLTSLKDDLFKRNSLTNIEKGNEGENKVFIALNDNPRWNDLSIEDVSKIQGCGDLVVSIPSINFLAFIEIKNEIQIQKQKDMVQFDEHKEAFFKKYDDCHAIFISLNTDRIPHQGSYNIVNQNNKFVGYFAKKNMEHDHIKSIFYGFVDTILTHRNLNIKTDNSIQLCDNLIKDNNLFDIFVDNSNKQIKYHEEQISLITDNINKMNINMKNNNILLKDEGFSINSSLICKPREERIANLKKDLIDKQIFNINYSKTEFKSIWTKNSKENQLNKKEKILSNHTLPKNMTYDSIYEELTK